jgi:hypothetical protein
MTVVGAVEESSYEAVSISLLIKAEELTRNG